MTKDAFVADYKEYKKRLTEALPKIFGADVELTGLELVYDDDYIEPNVETALGFASEVKSEPKCYIKIQGFIDLS